MDKDTKILLMAVVIILVALVSFNITDLTGKAVTKGSITVSPSQVSFAKYQTQAAITVKLAIGKEAVDADMYLYKDGSGKVGTERISLCRSSTCSQTDLQTSYIYNLHAGLSDGTYYFIARGRQFNDIIATSNRFTIVHKN